MSDFLKASPGPSFLPPRLSRAVYRIRQSKPKSFAFLAGFCVLFYWLFLSSSSARTHLPSPPAPYGSPNVVVVTSMTADSAPYRRLVFSNREAYTKKHGYGLLISEASEYDLQTSPDTWAKVPALRHAMAVYPYSTYFFYLSPQALIANMDISIEKHLMSSKFLKESVIKNFPVVPPDSIIRTFSNQQPADIDLLISQDKDGLGKDSLILRRTEWSKFFLDVWFETLYRSYNFQKAEQHALEHIVQWHSTILSKLAIVKQRALNSYVDVSALRAETDGVFKPGDFVINFTGCNISPRNCEQEMSVYFS